MNILVSACLLGVHCRYDGTGKHMGELDKWKEKHNFIPVCPEQLGGLPTPREASERLGDKVFSKSHKDVTAEFKKGAKETLKLAKYYNVSLAIMKERSPSCGCKIIYDGTFSGKRVEGNGVAVDALLQAGIKVYGESEIEVLDTL